MDPAGGLAEALAERAGFALQERHLARARRGLWRRPARPAPPPDRPRPIRRARRRGLRSGFRSWVRNSATSKPMPPAPTMATRAPTGAPGEHLGIGQHMPARRSGCAGSRGVTPVAMTISSKPARSSGVASVPSRVVDPGLRHHRLEPGDEAAELLLAGHPGGVVQLAADPRRPCRTG